MPTLATTSTSIMLKNIENQTSSLGTGNKRNADQMLEQFEASPVVSPSAETVSSDAPSDTENYTLKKPRLSEEKPAEKIGPSKVLHIRSLPIETSEDDIMVLAKPYGQVTNMILMRNKRQAFVEMGDISQAINFFNKHQNPQFPARIRGLPVQIQYSATYKELLPGQRSDANGMKSTPVLHVNVDNHLLPVSLSIVYQVFSRYGVVQKIITFTKNDQFQCLIQMANVGAAQAAKNNLDGKNIFPNCCTLRIDFSKMLSINVKYNNDKSRDFTNPHLPSGDDLQQAAINPSGPKNHGAKQIKSSSNIVQLPQISINTQLTNPAVSSAPPAAAQAAALPQPGLPASAAAHHNLSLASYTQSLPQNVPGSMLATGNPSAAQMNQQLASLAASGYRVMLPGAMVRIPAPQAGVDQLTLQQQLAAQQLSAMQQLSGHNPLQAAQQQYATQAQAIMYRPQALPTVNQPMAAPGQQMYTNQTSPQATAHLLQLQQLMASRVPQLASANTILHHHNAPSDLLRTTNPATNNQHLQLTNLKNEPLPET